MLTACKGMLTACGTYIDSLRLPIRTYLTPSGLYHLLQQRIGSRFFVCLAVTNDTFMKAISIKALGLPLNALSRVIRTVVSLRYRFAVTGAAAALMGAISDADTMLYGGAILAIIAVNPGKGGEA